MVCHNCNRKIMTTAICPYCGVRTLSGKYRIDGVLGEGGFGITYLGYNNKIGLPIAVKEYFPQGISYRNTAVSNEVYTASQDAGEMFAHGKDRFLSEARVLARFGDEPGVVSVIDFIEENSTAYLVMEYLDGETLLQYLKRTGTMKPEDAFEMLEPVMRTLEKIHAAGVIHRDISADNIMMVKNGQLKLMDFGAAREYIDENRWMSVMLKKGYAPEEQYRSKGEQGPWTDVYAVCATIYRCITGQKPVDSLERLVNDTIKKPSQLGVNLSPALENLLMYGLAVFKKDRCQDMREFLRLLDQAKNADRYVKENINQDSTVLSDKTYVDMATSAHADRKKEQDQPKKGRAKPLIIAAAVLMITAVLIAVLVSQFNKNSPASNADAADYQYKVLANNTAEISGYTGSEKELNIPDRIDGYTVTEIGYKAFENRTDLTAVTIPDSVTNIGDYAFAGCGGLGSLTIGNSVTSIGDYAFLDCKGLTSVIIPDSVTGIGSSAFLDCDSLSSVTIGSSVADIGISAFYCCKKLSAVTIPDSVTSIGDYAFRDCAALTSVNIPASVTKIGLSAFENCEGLTAVTVEDIAAWCSIGFDSEYSNPLMYAHQLYMNEKPVSDIAIPDTVTRIGDCAFIGCSSLTSVTIPDSVTDIGVDAFHTCSNLVAVNLPDSITSIGEYAFYQCEKLSSLIIPDAVSYIGEKAFSGCGSLTSVNIPDSVTSIGEDVFYGCSGLTSVSIPDSVKAIGEGAFQNCSGLTSVTIPDSVWSIGNDAFNGCSNLSSVTIGKGVKKIGVYAFYNCTSMSIVMIPNTVTTIEGYSFGWYEVDFSPVSVAGFTISGEAGSPAEQYAFDNGFEFHVL